MNRPVPKSQTLRILIVDGYDKDGRAELEAFGCGHAAPLYEKMLSACLPDGFSVSADHVFPADAGSSLPQGKALEKFHGIAWTGSSLTIHKDEPRVTRQIEYARELYASQVPQFGSCWAVQIAASAAGGVCTANPKGREFGLSRKITLSEAGRAHPMYRAKPTSFDAFTVHYDMVETAPAGATLLASSKLTDIQALDIQYNGGSFWAVQYHPEFTLDYMARLAAGRTDSLIKDGHFADGEAANSFIDDWTTLGNAPARTDIAWRHGIDDDILNEKMRFAEARNWIEACVIPRLG